MTNLLVLMNCYCNAKHPWLNVGLPRGWDKQRKKNEFPSAYGQRMRKCPDRKVSAQNWTRRRRSRNRVFIGKARWYRHVRHFQGRWSQPHNNGQTFIGNENKQSVTWSGFRFPFHFALPICCILASCVFICLPNVFVCPLPPPTAISVLIGMAIDTWVWWIFEHKAIS